MDPIYTADNTAAAFQLNWSVALFGKMDLPAPPTWIDDLRTATQCDGVRILEHLHTSPNVLQFMVSTQPTLLDPTIVRYLVPRTGVEPARGCPHNDLNVARLPIPPPGLCNANSVVPKTARTSRLRCAAIGLQARV